MLVPDVVVVPPPIARETIPTPGAKMSVVSLLSVKPATLSALSVAPTAITSLRQAGAPMRKLRAALSDECKTVRDD